MIAKLTVSRGGVRDENFVCGIGRAAVFEDRRPGGRCGSAAESAGGAGPRGGGGVAAVPGDQGVRRGDAKPDDSNGRNAAAISGDRGRRSAERRAIFLRG